MDFNSRLTISPAILYLVTTKSSAMVFSTSFSSAISTSQVLCWSRDLQIPASTTFGAVDANGVCACVQNASTGVLELFKMFYLGLEEIFRLTLPGFPLVNIQLFVNSTHFLPGLEVKIH